MWRLSSRVIRVMMSRSSGWRAWRWMPSKMFIARLSRKNCSVATSSTGSSAASSASNIISVPSVDVLDLLVHLLDEAAVRQVVARLVHRLGHGVIAVVFFPQLQRELRADVLRDALADLQDVQDAAEAAPRDVRLHRIRQGFEGRRARKGRPLVVDQRIVRRDRHRPVDVALEVPVRRVRLGEQGVDPLMSGVVQLQQLACPHGSSSPVPTSLTRAASFVTGLRGLRPASFLCDRSPLGR